MSEQSLISEEDYESIEAAVMETARGRWFLQEYARRNRNADTKMVLGAVKRVEEVLADQTRANEEAEKMRAELVEMGTAIAKTRQEIAALKPEGDDSDSIFSATDELECIVRQTEKATQDILSTAEQIQEIAWTLRENKVDEEHCAALDSFATDIYIACSFQDLTGQRTARIVGAIQALEKRINSMVDIWYLDESEVEEDDIVFVDNSEKDLLNGPRDDGIKQDTVDVLIDEHSSYAPPVETVSEVQAQEPAPFEPAPLVDHHDAALSASPHSSGRIIAADDEMLDLAFVDHADQVPNEEQQGDTDQTESDVTADAQTSEELVAEEVVAETIDADAPEAAEQDYVTELANEETYSHNEEYFDELEPDVHTLVEAAQDAQMHVAETRNAEKQNAAPAPVEQDVAHDDDGLSNLDADPELMSDGQKAALFS